MDEKIIKKFWDNVEKTKSCWNWTGFLDKSGLPIIQYSTENKSCKSYSPRRVSLTLAGQILDTTAHVKPWCRNKLCVNPSHLAHGDEARFWAKVQKMGDDDCWAWIAAQDKDMYGKFRLCENGKKIDVRAHQYAYYLATGFMPHALHVCHTCDHPYCVNPSHLFLVTIQENTQDRHQKGRDAKGEKSGNAKLTANKIQEIRKLRKEGMSLAQLSSQFQVSKTTISGIANHKTWKHVL